MDVMMNQEPFSNLWAVLFIIGVMELGAARPERRLRWGLALGCTAAAGVLTKASALILPAAIGLGALLELIQRRELPWGQRLKRSYAWWAGLALCLALAAPQYIYNRQVNGKMIIDGWYRRPTADWLRDGSFKKELLDRRTLGFVFAFNADVVRFPYYPSGLSPSARFWPTLIGSSFSDYYNYSFNRPRDRQGSLLANGRPVGAGITTSSAQASVASGLAISALAALAWFLAIPRLLLQREVSRPVVLALPMLGALGLLAMCIESPYDFEGIVKGHYFQFAGWPLYALFGLSVSWLLSRRGLAPLGWLCTLLIVPPFVYSWVCVMR
jgi:4-amino-4-deoxy-L-arabinose transferase-like glycosyltransferase